MRIRIDRDQWGEIYDSLARNKTRTFLTAFGVFWGIFMLVLLMGGGKGLESMLAENFAGFATNSGFVVRPVRFLGKILLVFALLHSVFQGQICLLLQVFLDFLLLHSSPL